MKEAVLKNDRETRKFNQYDFDYGTTFNQVKQNQKP